MGILSHQQLLSLHAEIVAAGLGTEVLTLRTGINPHFLCALPTASSPSSQLLLDLSALNDTPQLPDGSLPMLIWLQNAATLTAGRPSELLLRDLIGCLQHADTGTMPIGSRDAIFVPLHSSKVLPP